MPSQAHALHFPPIGPDPSQGPVSTTRSRAPAARHETSRPCFPPAVDRDLLTLVDDVLLGDHDAWTELWLRIAPLIDRVTARRRFASALYRDDDERREIALRVMESLRANAFRRLRAFSESAYERPSSSFEAWITTVAIRATIDHVRAHPELLRQGGVPGWVRLVGFRDHHQAHGRDLRGELEARDLLRRARVVLSSDQYEGLILRMTGHDDDEIARRLDVGDQMAADRLVRAGIKRLRHHAREGT